MPIGHKMSPETRAKMREAANRRWLDPEQRALMASIATGRVHSPETKAKIAAASRGRMTGRTVSPETRAKMSAAANRRWQSPEQRALMASIQSGKTHTPETRDKIKNLPAIGECVYCFGAAQTYDHVIPRGRPGWDDPDNVVLACSWCNRSKGGRTPEEWFAQMT